jgi:hypothetical protein
MGIQISELSIKIYHRLSVHPLVSQLEPNLGAILTVHQLGIHQLKTRQSRCSPRLEEGCSF